MQETLRHSSRQSFDLVYDSILDVQKFGALHPNMTEVTIIGETAEYVEYAIKERIKVWGFIPMRPEYTAKVFEIEKGKRIRYTSLVNGKVPLVNEFLFERKDENSPLEITETIQLEGNKMIASTLMGLMKKTHTAIFEKLK